MGDKAEQAVERWFTIVRTLPALTAALDLDPKKDVAISYYEGSLGGGEDVLKSQAWVGEVIQGLPDGVKVVSTTIEGIDLHLQVEGVIDLEKLGAKLANEEVKLQADFIKISDRLQNPQFIERAKPEIVEKEQALVADLQDRLEKIKARRALLGV